MCDHKCLVRMLIFEKRHILYNGIFNYHRNICYVILINAYFCKVHSVCPVNVCTNC